jgi:hypothetical protein
MELLREPLLRRIKDKLLSNYLFSSIWGNMRCRQLHRNYESRSEHYAALVREHGTTIYQEDDVVNNVKARLSRRGWTPVIRKIGEIHTFAFIPMRSGHSQFLPDIRELGPLSLFDYEKLGFRVTEFRKGDSAGIERRKKMNELFFQALREKHAERPVDWVFIYASGVEISANTIQRITDELGIPTVSLCMDDKQSWTGVWMGDHPAGQIGIAPVFDISWTTARVACEWYLVEGGRPIYMPEGFDISTFHPTGANQDIPVSFVGSAYGYRPAIIRFLRNHSVPVKTFGHGWADTEWINNPTDIFNRSLINLGMGGIGYSESLTNIKGRDFDVPGTGGGLYITSFNPDLPQHFVIGEEIVCYRNRYEMLELIRYYLARPKELRAIAKQGLERCLSEHRWVHRYQHVCKILGVLS